MPRARSADPRPWSPASPPTRSVPAPSHGVRALWWEDDALLALDQRLLPGSEKILRLERLSQVAEAIRTLAIRGAPSIGVGAAYGMALAARRERLSSGEAADILRATRPTAHDLFVGIEVVRRVWARGDDPLKAAQRYRDGVVGECQAIGRSGTPLISEGSRVLTHCNAGALATVEWGTALAPIRMAHEAGRDPFVWVDETRPLLQGSRLTAWELQKEGIRHAVIADNAAGHFLHRREVDLVLVGADRVALNGDFANKVGTYEKAVVAHENGVPFFVAAPWSTFDPTLADGAGIPVEERGREEVAEFAGVPTAPSRSPVRNPAFDVTPFRYVRGFVTPAGVVRPAELAAHLKRHRPPDLHIAPAPARATRPRGRPAPPA